MTPDPIIAALGEQAACYRKLAKLAEAQRQHIQNSATEALLEVLRGRQQVLDQIASHEWVIAPVKQRWADYAANLTPEWRTRAEALLAETRELLEQITISDRDDVLALQQRKISLGRQIQQTSNARQVNRKYASAAYGKTASRMDLQT